MAQPAITRSRPEVTQPGEFSGQVRMRFDKEGARIAPRSLRSAAGVHRLPLAHSRLVTIRHHVIEIDRGAVSAQDRPVEPALLQFDDVRTGFCWADVYRKSGGG